MNATGIESVRETLRGREILVTGFTGFLGKVLVAFLLDRAPGIGRIVVLARGQRGQTAVQRVQRIVERSPCFRPLRERYGGHLAAFLHDKLWVVDGDVRQPLLGIDARALEALRSRIDCVVHLAGLTDFEPDPRDGIAVNVRGALHAADLAARTRGRRLLHVSTCFVAGQGSREVPESLTPRRSPNGTRFDPEGELLAIDSLCDAIDERHEGEPAIARKARIEGGTRRARALGWPNLYTYTKGLAEHLLAEREDVAVTIVRPAIVECAREFPFPGWNEGLNTSAPLVWLVGTLHRRMPLRGGHHFDVVPVDSVARGTTLALVDALRDRNGTGGVRAIRQLASSDHHPLTLGRALDLTTIARRRQYARSDDLFERWVLVHLDSVLAERAAEHDPWLPAARRVLRTLRDVLSGFDPDVHLPRGIRDRVGDALSRRVQKASKALGTAARTLGRIEEMLRAYQPFVWDDDFVFRTDATRAATAMLDPEERALFGFDVDTLDWRHYWLEVQIPGLDRWSLPLLRGEQPPEDPPFALEPPLCAVGTSDFEHTPAPMFGAFEETAAPLGEDTE